MLKGAFNKRLRSRMAVLCKQALIETSSIHTDSNGNFLFFTNIDYSLHAILPADIARIDADFGGTGFCRRNCQLIIKVNICHQRQRTFFYDLSKSSGAFHIGNSKTNDLATSSFQLTNLLQRRGNIRGLGVQHRLNHNRRAAANLYITYNYLSGHRYHPLNIVKISLNVMSAIKASKSTMPAPWIYASYLGSIFFFVMD